MVGKRGCSGLWTPRKLAGSRRTLQTHPARVGSGPAKCWVSCMRAIVGTEGLEDRSIVAPFPMSHYITAPFPYKLKLSVGAEKRHQIQRFVTWLHSTANETQREIEELSNQKVLTR